MLLVYSMLVSWRPVHMKSIPTVMRHFGDLVLAKVFETKVAEAGEMSAVRDLETRQLATNN